MLAAIAAVLIVPISQAHYLMGGDPLLLSFIVVIIGGLGSLRGTVVAALLIGLSRRHHLGLLLADAGQDPRDAARRPGAGVPPAGPVRHGAAMTACDAAGSALARSHVLGASLLLRSRLQFAAAGLSATNLARIMVLAVFAMGYNLAFGYTGLLSLGHALFFAAGLYGAGLLVAHLGWPRPAALPAGLAAGALLAAASIGLLALRTTGVAFMIVTLMFAQAGYLAILYFGGVDPRRRGLRPRRAPPAPSAPLDLTADGPRYAVAFALFAAGLLASLALVRSPAGRVLVAIRENEERTRMLGYDTFRYRLLAARRLRPLRRRRRRRLRACSSAMSARPSPRSQYSILPLLWVLLGGAGTTLGPLVGTRSCSTSSTSPPASPSHLLVVGVALLALVLFAPRGLLGSLAARLRP